MENEEVSFDTYTVTATVEFMFNAFSKQHAIDLVEADLANIASDWNITNVEC